MKTHHKIFKSHPFAPGMITALCLALVTLAMNVLAGQPDILHATITNLPTIGEANRIRCQLRIYNPSLTPVTVSVPPVVSPLGYVVNATPTQVNLEPRQEKLLDLQISLQADGKYAMGLPLIVGDPQGRGQREVHVAAYFDVRRGRYTVSSYRALFMNPLKIEQDDKGRTAQMYRVGPTPAGWQDDPEMRTPRADVEELERMQRATVFETDWSQSSTRLRKTSAASEDTTITNILPAPQDEPQAELSGLAVTALGTLKYTSLAGTMRACYGWRVVVYALLGGAKAPIASTYVKSNGNWQVTFIPLGTPVQIEYQPENAFFSFADQADNTYYSFSSGQTYNPVPGATINEYSQAAYLANSSLVGLGDLFRDGMLMWDTLKGKGGGISPLRDKSIVVYYPNTSYQCGGQMPWSCASDSGFIWIIPTHASNREVMIHELSHQMNYEYWNSSLTGGPHGLYDCIGPQLAMVEGFADFMPKWVRFAQYDTLGEVETPPLFACPLQNRNELRVAATFWDLYDIVNDGNDKFAFSKENTVVGGYLKYGPQNNMGAFRSIYKLLVPFWDQPKIDAIFDQNFQ